MATEAGHHASRPYTSQDGAFHLNSGAFYNDAETDISGTLETVVGSSAAGGKVRGGFQVYSTAGVNVIATDLAGIWFATANLKSTALSTGDKIIASVEFSTNSSNLQVALFIPNSSGELINLTATGYSFSWMAVGS